MEPQQQERHQDDQPVPAADIVGRVGLEPTTQGL